MSLERSIPPIPLWSPKLCVHLQTEIWVLEMMEVRMSKDWRPTRASNPTCLVGVLKACALSGKLAPDLH